MSDKERKANKVSLLIIISVTLLILLMAFLHSKGIQYGKYYIKTYMILGMIAWLLSTFIASSWIRCFIKNRDKITSKDTVYLCLAILFIVGFILMMFTSFFKEDAIYLLHPHYRVDGIKVA